MKNAYRIVFKDGQPKIVTASRVTIHENSYELFHSERAEVDSKLVVINNHIIIPIENVLYIEKINE